LEGHALNKKLSKVHKLWATSTPKRMDAHNVKLNGENNDYTRSGQLCGWGKNGSKL